MTATNHALTGAVIGLVVGQPLVAVPAAIASHFVCDAIPHFGRSLPNNGYLKTKEFERYLVITGGLCVVLVAGLATFRPQHWVLASICAFAAASPDLLSLNRYIKVRQGKPWRGGLYSKFANRIQWFERPVGIIVEVAWAIIAIFLILPFMR